MVILPADRLAPPLVCHFVSDEELGKVLKRRRVVAPDVRSGQQRLVQCGEEPGAVSAWQLAFDERQGEAGVGGIAQQRSVETGDLVRAFAELASTADLPRIRLHGQFDVDVGCDREVDRLTTGETAQYERQIPQRLRRREQVNLGRLGRVLAGNGRGKAGVERSARHAIHVVRHGDSQAGGRVVRDGRLWIPVAAVAVQETAFGQKHDRLLDLTLRPARSLGRESLRVLALRLEPARVRNRQDQVIVAQQHRRQVDR